MKQTTPSIVNFYYLQTPYIVLRFLKSWVMGIIPLFDWGEANAPFCYLKIHHNK